MEKIMREATIHDIEDIRRLMEELSGKPVTTAIMQNRLELIQQSPIDWLYVCEEAGKIIGFFAFRIRQNLHEVSQYGEISAIVVSSEIRGKGVGKFLLQYAEKLAVEKGCIGTWLVSGMHRAEAAHKFYQHMGYEITGRRFVKLNKGS